MALTSISRNHLARPQNATLVSTNFLFFWVLLLHFQNEVLFCPEAPSVFLIYFKQEVARRYEVGSQMAKALFLPPIQSATDLDSQMSLILPTEVQSVISVEAIQAKSSVEAS